jgi:hypothetical protein
MGSLYRLRTEATPLATHSKDLKKLAILLDYKGPPMLCLDLVPFQISGMILVNKVVSKLNVLLNSYFYIEKKSE